MKLCALCLPLAFALQAQDPNNADRLREQLDRITLNPATDLNDPAARSREVLRLPLNADPNVSLAELQSAQTTLIRLNDLLNAQAERAALTRLPSPETQFLTLVLPFPLAASRLPATSPNLALAKPTRQSSVRFYPSRGGVDGRITGTPGFDTERQTNPWWQVDLERVTPITEIRIYNSRIHPENARTLEVKTSLDGESWQTVYSNPGQTFDILRVPLQPTRTRFLRLQLTETSSLHLDEVEVYGIQPQK